MAASLSSTSASVPSSSATAVSSQPLIKAAGGELPTVTLPGKFPLSFARYKKYCVHFPYGSKEEAKKLVALVAERVSTIFSKFLTFKYHKKKENHLSFSLLSTSQYPDPLTINNFKMHLKEGIIKSLCAKDKEGDSLRWLCIETNPFGVPVGILAEPIAALNISEPYTLFPHKVAVHMVLTKNQLRVAFVNSCEPDKKVSHI